MNQTQIVLGVWKNQYGSLLHIIKHTEEGFFDGYYSSTTGSSGLYLVKGCVNQHSTHKNLSISFSVFWKAINNKEADESWHWGSMMSGNVFTDAPNNTLQIEVLHGMIASTPFEKVEIQKPNIFFETLTFTKQNTPLLPIQFEQESIETKQAIQFSCVPTESLYRSLDITYNHLGQAEGFLKLSHQDTIQVFGFIDPYPINNLQSITLHAQLPFMQETITVNIGGIIPLNNQATTLYVLQSKSTLYKNKYTATSIHPLNLSVHHFLF